MSVAANGKLHPYSFGMPVTKVTVSYSIGVYLAAFTRECSKVYSVGDIVADCT